MAAVSPNSHTTSAYLVSDGQHLGLLCNATVDGKLHRHFVALKGQCSFFKDYVKCSIGLFNMFWESGMVASMEGLSSMNLLRSMVGTRDYIIQTLN